MSIINEENTEYLLNLLKQIKQEHSTQEEHKAIIRTKLTQSDKIKFACEYYDTFGAASLLNILEQTDDQNLKREIIEFMIRNSLLKPYPSSNREYRKKISEASINDQRAKSLSARSIRREYNFQNWLEIFNENAIFNENLIKRPVYQIRLNNDNVPVKFDKKRATKVKLAIIDAGLFPARCIVESAYAYDAKDEMPKYFEYVKSLKGGK